MLDRRLPSSRERESRFGSRSRTARPAVGVKCTGSPIRALGARARTDRRDPGFTIAELLVVVTILAALAGLVLPRLSDVLNGRTDRVEAGQYPGARVQAARASMMVVRAAILGTPDQPGFKTDLREYPNRLQDLFVAPATLPSGKPVPPFDPARSICWKGPYLQEGTGQYQSNTRGFTSAYGDDGARAVLDPWSRPIVLQWPDLAVPDREKFLRLVSAGPDGVIDTLSAIPTPGAASIGDDVVVYLTWNGP